MHVYVYVCMNAGCNVHVRQWSQSMYVFVHRTYAGRIDAVCYVVLRGGVDKKHRQHKKHTTHKEAYSTLMSDVNADLAGVVSSVSFVFVSVPPCFVFPDLSNWEYCLDASQHCLNYDVAEGRPSRKHAYLG